MFRTLRKGEYGRAIGVNPESDVVSTADVGLVSEGI